MVEPSSEHIVSSYEDELKELARLISEMGGLVEQAVTNSVNGLVRMDDELARGVVKSDQEVDDMQRRIDDLAVSMIARRQPMASDLRQIISTIHVATDLERIGDMAKNIGRRTIEIGDRQMSAQLYSGLKHMSELALRQIDRALDVFNARDEIGAVEVCRRDDELDSLYMSLFREFLTYMMEDPRNISDCTHLLFCAKNLERAGDHATNIAEAAYYLKTGKSLVLESDSMGTVG
ncbi:phosphate signaling complex protein PhoU [Cucumibacter marinus]|uniref:phosphate signaling complex protein PhoU n=1 Tax=Cucumibacter marinus TaxID=1121252 RepID=UPI00041AC49A|nr:phosphate signaling complex protein PhoU [Cucumibacter marinus]